MTWQALGWTVAILLAGSSTPAQGAPLHTQDRDPGAHGDPGSPDLDASQGHSHPAPVAADLPASGAVPTPAPRSIPGSGAKPSDRQTPDPGARVPASIGRAEQIRPIDPRFAPPLALKVDRSKQTYQVDLFDAQGRLRHDALAQLRTILFDPRTGIDHPIHWRLATLLVAVAAHYPDKTIEVISGYRNVSRHTDRSNHTRGRAIDMRVVGVDNRRLFDTLRRSFADVGVGYYPNSTFIHLDVRDQATLWVDYSGPGQTPCYSRAPARDLREGIAERTSYEQAIAAGCRKAG